MDSDLKYMVVFESDERPRDFNEWVATEIYEFNKDGESGCRPSHYPPPVYVAGPYAPGDPRGLTYMTKSKDDAEAFVAHILKAGLIITNYWIDDLAVIRVIES